MNMRVDGRQVARYQALIYLIRPKKKSDRTTSLLFGLCAARWKINRSNSSPIGLLSVFVASCFGADAGGVADAACFGFGNDFSG